MIVMANDTAARLAVEVVMYRQVPDRTWTGRKIPLKTGEWVVGVRFGRNLSWGYGTFHQEFRAAELARKLVGFFRDQAMHDWISEVSPILEAAVLEDKRVHKSLSCG